MNTLSKIGLILMIFSIIYSCNLISTPECELLSYKALEPVNGDPVFLRLEVENVSEKDYAYGVKCFIKAYSGNSIQQIKQVSFGTMKAGQVVESRGYLDSLDNFNNIDKFKMTLEWFGDTDARFKKEYEYILEDTVSK